ncbi:bifunctional 3-deoxy-7-phosphoheptulonate synthase/chorismate mutase [Effusibacillus lacus]|uniref:Bifunctional 3-deoxy-7-phosphoheptulonate synthase/chorismate mutase n=1 Tax=Effusibacillus lacus TaxID=1348429 RepID=A0A292YRH7_9BACL|nr:bifunctional 3-deoxy-7-phosphoheptulonate synthase/chorismate mutase [Effusibacillus lacus]TCS70093.1 3-deoxy-D-arabinoheptulosonate-7-phosphate synthase /chorismate mutase [Effusibacillus lacus]GAX91070.1 bifunctional 3-deoxy-7-phosphoheptulonate synthase/chorismate mutase [Effusibacillus lacus]
MTRERLEEIRAQLDEINLEILELLSRRAELVQEIGDLKKRKGTERFDPIREKEMLDRLVAANPGPFDDSTVRHLFKQIFQASLGLMEEEKKELLVSRKKRTEDTVIEVNGVRIGGGQPVIIAGPCSVETPEQMDAVGAGLQQHGILLLRGGAYKPRTSPYDFQGLGKKGLELIRKTADKYGMAVVSEIVSPSDIEMSLEYVDVIQIGARNMQNFELLKEAGNVRKPVLLKRGMSATIEELLFAAEYIVSRGNTEVILCERGIRTYEKATRNTLDISAVPILKQESHLPVIVDITHSTGRKDILLPIAKAALAVGADGLIVEVHPEPSVALSDAKQQLNLPQFAQWMEGLKASGYLPKQEPVPVK